MVALIKDYVRTTHGKTHNTYAFRFRLVLAS